MFSNDFNTNFKQNVPVKTKSQAVARIADRTASQQTLVPN